MVALNLLPWRTYDVLHRKKTIRRTWLGSIFFTFFLIVLIHVVLSKKVAFLSSQIDFLKNELMNASNVQVDQEKTKSNKMLNPAGGYDQATIQKLFVSLAQSRVDPVCFLDITRNERHVTFIGKARSLSDLTTYLLHWKAAGLFDSVQLKEIKQEKQFVHFNIQAMEEEYVDQDK